MHTHIHTAYSMENTSPFRTIFQSLTLTQVDWKCLVFIRDRKNTVCDFTWYVFDSDISKMLVLKRVFWRKRKVCGLRTGLQMSLFVDAMDLYLWAKAFRCCLLLEDVCMYVCVYDVHGTMLIQR